METPRITSEEAVEMLTVEAFRRWLRLKPENAIVGLEATRNACPIARFYAERGVRVRVGERFADSVKEMQVIGDKAVPLPRWAQLFADWVDMGAASKTFPIPRPYAPDPDEHAIRPCEEDEPYAVAEIEAGEEVYYQFTRDMPIAGKALPLVSLAAKAADKEAGNHTPCV